MGRYIVTGAGLVMDTKTGEIFSHQQVIRSAERGQNHPLSLWRWLDQKSALSLRHFDTIEQERQVLLQEEGEIFSGRPAHLMWDAPCGRLAG